MNDVTAQQLAAAIQALAAAATAAPPPPAAPVTPAVPTFILLYEGDALNLSSRTGTSLFQKGSEPLDTSSLAKLRISICSLQTSRIMQKHVIGTPQHMALSH